MLRSSGPGIQAASEKSFLSAWIPGSRAFRRAPRNDSSCFCCSALFANQWSRVGISSKSVTSMTLPISAFISS
jgi:hypothetical protein